MELPVFDREPATPVVRSAFRRTQWVWERDVLRFFERLQDPALHWRLGRSRTIAQILTHVGAVVGFYQRTLHDGLKERVSEPAWSIGDEGLAFYDEAHYVQHERSWYEKLLMGSYAEYMSVLLAVMDPDLETICTTPGQPRQRTVEWVLHQVPGHTNYHVGQVNYIHGRYEETVAADPPTR